MGEGHAREARFLQRMHAKQGLDVVRLNPGFVYGPGGLLRSAFVEQARKGRLRRIGNARTGGVACTSTTSAVPMPRP
jgi:nucleoside-diphosphate-sugar epimerase